MVGKKKKNGSNKPARAKTTSIIMIIRIITAISSKTLIMIQINLKSFEIIDYFLLFRRRFAC